MSRAADFSKGMSNATTGQKASKALARYAKELFASKPAPAPSHIAPAQPNAPATHAIEITETYTPPTQRQ